MKQGKDIVQLATELQRRAEAKVDFVAPTKRVHLVPEEHADGTATQKLIVQNGEDREYDLTQHTHRQLGTWAKVPAKYYDRMLAEAPNLLAGNINHWLMNSEANRMVRTLDGTARAFLSDRYRRIDNEDVAEQVLPILLDSGNFSEVVSTEVTDSRLYIKALFPKVEGEVAEGDQVQAGVIISNSEIGLGSLSIQPLIYRLVCSNGMISQDHGLSRYHVGRKVAGDGDNAFEVFRDETIAADDAALMMKVHDIVKACANPEVFDAIVQKMRDATEGERVQKPVEAVEVLSKSFSLNDGEKDSVLEQLIRGGDYSRYGMLNAVTATANTHESYDRATDLEAMGGKILDLPRKDWEVIATAA